MDKPLDRSRLSNVACAIIGRYLPLGGKDNLGAVVGLIPYHAHLMRQITNNAVDEQYAALIVSEVARLFNEKIGKRNDGEGLIIRHELMSMENKDGGESKENKVEVKLADPLIPVSPVVEIVSPSSDCYHENVSDKVNLPNITNQLSSLTFDCYHEPESGIVSSASESSSSSLSSSSSSSSIASSSPVPGVSPGPAPIPGSSNTNLKVREDEKIDPELSSINEIILEGDDFLLANCPHCYRRVSVDKNMLACTIFRCGILHGNPHASEAECGRLFVEARIHGCGRPFKWTDKGPVKCDYI